MRRESSRDVLLMVAVSAVAGAASAQNRVYVDAGAGGETHDGKSWCTAFLSLQDGLDAAGEGGMVLVAGGTYVPDAGTLDDPRDATFNLRNGVRLNGGYAGCGAEDPDARDPAVYVTVLSGDLLGDDGPDFSNNSDNCYHVVTCYAAGPETKLGGFTITAGNANGRWEDNRHTGAGMLNMLSDPQIHECVFIGNAARGVDGTGAGMANLVSNASIRKSAFTRNTAQHGAGMANVASDVVVSSCEVDENHARVHGGGVLSVLGSQVLFKRSTFHLNTTENYGLGGGMLIDMSSALLVRCTLSSNYGDEKGGAIYVRDGAVQLAFCDVADNRTASWQSTSGGGISLSRSNAVLQNTFLEGNFSGGYGGALSGGEGVEIDNCQFFNNQSGNGGAISPGRTYTISNSLFLDNHASDLYGGAIFGYYTTLHISGCRFVGNSGPRGGALVTGQYSPQVINCEFSLNNANSGGAIYSNYALNLIGCVIKNNTGSALYYRRSEDCVITNSIYWGNTPARIFGTPTITYSDIEGGWTGEGNIDLDPLFQDADNGDLRLAADSPCINAGTNDAVSSEFDLDGNPRIVGGRVDMGAYEYLCDSVTGLTAECTEHGVRATVASSLPPGSALTLLLEGDAPRRVILNEEGVGRARWRTTASPATTCVLGCSDTCVDAVCD